MANKKIIGLIILISISTVILNGCKKEEPKPDCEVNKYGTITISNSSTNPYTIDIDGVYKMQLAAGSISEKIRINEGNSRVLHCKQVSGYLIYPTEKTTNLNVVRCSDYSWQIP